MFLQFKTEEIFNTQSLIDLFLFVLIQAGGEIIDLDILPLVFILCDDDLARELFLEGLLSAFGLELGAAPRGFRVGTEILPARTIAARIDAGIAEIGATHRRAAGPGSGR